MNSKENASSLSFLIIMIQIHFFLKRFLICLNSFSILYKWIRSPTQPKFSPFPYFLFVVCFPKQLFLYLLNALDLPAKNIIHLAISTI